MTVCVKAASLQLTPITSELDSGNDYLPFFLDRWLREDSHICFIALAPASSLAPLDLLSEEAPLEDADENVIVGHSSIGLFDQGRSVTLLKDNPRKYLRNLFAPLM